MGKVTVLSTVGVVGSGLSVTGAYMLGAFGDASYLAKNLDEFKENGGGTCAQSLFPGLSVEKKGGKLGENSNKVDSTNSFAADGEVGSCLVVNWERDNYTVSDSSEKGSGNFRGSWSFKKGNQGFVLFALAKTSESAQQLDLTGGFYYVSRDSENDPWFVKKYDELAPSEQKKISQSDFSNNFPSVGTGIEGVDNGKLNAQYPDWGFVFAGSDLSKLCQTGDSCVSKKPKSSDWFRGYGIWKSMAAGSSDILSTGTGNMYSSSNGGLENMYDKNSKLDLSNVFTSMNGKGEKNILKTSVKKKDS